MSCEINFKETAVQRRSQRPNSGNHPAPLPPLPETPDAHAVSGSLNISFLGARVLVTSRCLSLRRLCTNRPLGRSCGDFAKSRFFFPSTLFLYKYGSSFDFQQQLAGRRWANIPLWFSASGPVHHGGFPCQINITRVIHWHHRLSQLGPGIVPTITLYLWYC